MIVKSEAHFETQTAPCDLPTHCENEIPELLVSEDESTRVLVSESDQEPLALNVVIVTPNPGW